MQLELNAKTHKEQWFEKLFASSVFDTYVHGSLFSNSLLPIQFVRWCSVCLSSIKFNNYTV